MIKVVFKLLLYGSPLMNCISSPLDQGVPGGQNTNVEGVVWMEASVEF